MIKDSIVDGEGIRSVIWFQGCPHHCPGCHNPQSHKFNTGIKTTTAKMIKEISSLTNQDGITFSGGEPFSQPETLLELVKYTKERNLNVWIYTGFLYETLLDMARLDSIYLDILKYTDVLVDGKFEIVNKNLLLKFRGSSNQRIIDVKKSLNKGGAVQIAKYKYRPSPCLKTTHNVIYI